MLEFIANAADVHSTVGFWSTGLGTVCILAGATIIATIILGIGKAVKDLVRSKQKERREEALDQMRLSEFLFGVERDPRTGTPGRVGWAVTVDKSLEALTHGLNEVLSELKEDGNGRHNFRGIAERTAEALGVDLPPAPKNGDTNGPV